MKYVSYWGRGIIMCDRWLNSFSNFLQDMGPKPKGFSLERINNDGNYEPGNCKWATQKEQSRNKRQNRFITINGVTLVISDWARKLGCNRALISYRIIQLGWDAERAATTPPDRRFAPR